MQFTLLTTVLVACMTLMVSASPVPSPAEVEARTSFKLPREVNILDEVAREPSPEPICGKYTCL
ncbi:hypothetical protein CPC08DRAFT_765626 [Agrocybe pediades]|nr:hypothetical protein CPC08DRAFT_765626 [Agrocybe pediades]